ncbi:MAG: ABC transporter ATP-binding protein, partial [Candidatus Scatosoma sp.]
MLEVVHLTKIYKTKGGVETKALNDVSVRFPEKGLVFLLGKSGSGKSTLLNVCGGLDSPSSGEIIVKGRSSKNFSQSDFDSYRNTFIGFVFQEYNILNEFTVEDNIALALELQGKSKDRKAIKALLDEVELGAYARRKPNTLSGGQKQRIAIARALIKQPEIIMADEPTGALDSATGKQVFDTLKKLSQKKLVIVVSHDRDSAEEYADRIIELKDGKIISDVTKEAAAAQSLGENLSVIGENTLSVKNGATLTEQDYRYIYAFLSNHQGAMIRSGEKEIADFKKASHITEEGGKEFVADTDEKKIPKKKYDPKKTQFIRSKLPLRHAFKIGVSGLKSKPFRLIFTVLLCSVAFIMFGLFSTLTFYDKNETLYQTLDDSGVTVLHADKTYQTIRTWTNTDGDTYSYSDYFSTKMTEEEVQKIASAFGAETFGVIQTDKTISGVNVSDLGSYYYAGYSLDARKIAYGAYLPEGHAFRSKIPADAYPENDDEICISTYTASALVAAKYADVTSTQDLIGKTVSFESYSSSSIPSSFKIVGIFDIGDKNFTAE